MNAEQAAQALGRSFKTSGKGVETHCPCHDDKNPSFHITQGDDGKLLFHCKAGCNQDVVLAAVKAAGALPENKQSQVVAEFHYKNAAGHVLYTKQRIEPGDNGKLKKFLFKSGAGFKRGCNPVLYNLPAIQAAETVYITEGEKQADKLAGWDLVGTTLDSGSSANPTKTDLLPLTDKHVVILSDNDDPGQKYANNLKDALQSTAASIKVVTLPDLPRKGDIMDWSGDKAELLALVGLTEEDTTDQDQGDKKTPSRKITVINIEDFLALEIPHRGHLLEPVIPQQGLTMVFAPRGIGKTHLSLGIAHAVASGGEFLKWAAPEAKGVLLLDGEMPAKTLQERLARIVLSNEKEPTAPLRIVTPDLQESGMLNLSSAEDQENLAQYLEGIELIIIDNLSTLCRSGRENEAESWLPVQAWALQQRAAGRSVMFIHHSGKNGEQRGTSRREDVLDTVLKLKLPGDYTPDRGANFEVHFVKSRGVFGDETKPFEAQLTVTPDGRDEWAIKSLELSTAEKVANLLNEGIPQQEIAELLNVSKGYVSKSKKRAQELGLLV